MTSTDDTSTNNDGDRVLIVGGSSGMGLALAAALLERGTAVTIAGRSEARLKAARAALPRTGRLDTVTTDIMREEEVVRLFARTGPLAHIVTTAASIEGAYRCCRTSRSRPRVG